MKFISTRGQAPAVGFADAVLGGLAPDGGLYMPEAWPKIEPRAIEEMAAAPYADVARTVLAPFMADGLDRPDAGHYAEMIAEAYATFRHPSVTPLVEIAPGRYVLELFHGPTLSFKDVAMQVLARFMDHLLAARCERATIVGATSGDTGSAAIEAFRGRDNIDIFILHPEGRTSAIQRRQMTTVSDANVHNIAVKGTFDDCQRLLKELFADRRFREEVRLSAVNSINFGRIAAQTVYYFKAAAQLGAPTRAVRFAVPTGNFGDVFAGYAAYCMGLPVDRLVVATNENDILRRALAEGRYETRTVVPTTSPSMDIQISSNFERLLFDCGGRDGLALAEQMRGFEQARAMRLTNAQREGAAALISSARADATEMAQAMAWAARECGEVIDPHTAIGLHAARAAELPREVPIVTLATAHPAKFPDAVERATGQRPALPARVGDLFERDERYVELPGDYVAIAAYVAERATPSR
jgi:threonine synthase